MVIINDAESGSEGFRKWLVSAGFEEVVRLRSKGK